jgi:MinD-like ATPase involved in chromosome partitioning or flagellar assembly
MGAKIISVHSFRGGTGKSNFSANLCYLLAKAGKRVCAVDMDIQSPGIHVLFQHERAERGRSLNDYLWGSCPIDKVPVDVSERLGLPAGRLHLLPCSMDMADIARILKQGYDIAALAKGLSEVRKSLALDYMVVDTHPGLDEETLMAISISDFLFILIRPDSQDYQGASVTVEIAKRLNVPSPYLVMNRARGGAQAEPALREKLDKAFGCAVGGLLPDCPELAELGSGGLLAMRSPGSAWVAGLEKITKLLS